MFIHAVEPRLGKIEFLSYLILAPTRKNIQILMKQKNFILDLPPNPLLFRWDYPEARKCAGAYTASEKLPESLNGLPDNPALYRFFIYDGKSLKYAYVGETVNLTRRMGQYCGMIRRLLLLYCGANSVCIEKHPVRHIQYCMAHALLSPGYEIKLCWTDFLPNVDKRGRIAAERAEVAHIRDANPHTLLLTGLAGNFHTAPFNPLSTEWQNVHTRLANRIHTDRNEFL